MLKTVNFEMVNIKKPSVAEINGMNNATLKQTMKEMVKAIEDAELEKQQHASNHEASVPELLQQLIDEVKKLNNEKQSIQGEIAALKTSNELLLQAVAQQQRFMETIDAEKRSRNLIFLGVPESENLATNDGVADTDETKINAILRLIGQGNVRPDSILRLGKEDPNRTRPRPMKVVMKSNVDQQKALADSKKLKEAEGKFKDIFIKRDVHPAVRKEMGRLYGVERNEKEKPENAGRAIVFDKQKRIITVDGVVVDRFKPTFF